MIKNVMIKNALINTVFSGLSWINKITSKDDRTILIYSDNALRDNNQYLLDFLVKNGYTNEYQIVCACKNYKELRDGAGGVRYVSPVGGVIEFLRAGHIFYSFGKLPIVPKSGQNVIQMWHGTSFKGFADNQVKTNSLKKQFYTYVYASSEYFVPIVKQKFQVDEDKIVICGHPRTDCFFEDTNPYSIAGYNKTIIWLPTLRRSKELGLEDGSEDSVIPILKNEDYEKLESLLVAQNILLIIKLHPAQNIGALPTIHSKHFWIMSNSEFTAGKYDLYRLLKQSDALITDYSSVFYDYLLLNRPIAFTEDDVEEYAQSRGFAVNDPDTFRPGKKLRTFEDLAVFINNVSTGHDDYAEARNRVNNIANYYQDGGNCQRTMEYSNVFLKANREELN